MHIQINSVVWCNRHKFLIPVLNKTLCLLIDDALYSSWHLSVKRIVRLIRSNWMELCAQCVIQHVKRYSHLHGACSTVQCCGKYVYVYMCTLSEVDARMAYRPLQ